MLGAIDAGLEALSGWGCSPFFLTSSALSVVSGEGNREVNILNAYEDDAFKRELDKQKEQYEDIKEAQEWAFKKWIKQIQRDRAKIRAKQKLENEFSKKELKQFFDDWPLRVSCESAIDRLSADSGSKSLAVIIGKHSIGGKKDMLSNEYDNIVSSVRDIIEKYGVNRECVFSFVESNRISGGAALASVFSCLFAFPVLMIQPYIIDGKLVFSLGLWTPDSKRPRQTHAMAIEWDENRARNEKTYLYEKKDEIIQISSSLICVINDVYKAIEFKTIPIFPRMVNESKICNRDLIRFAENEYESVLCKDLHVSYGGETIKVLDYAIDPFEFDELINIMKTAIKEIKLNDN